MLAFGIGMKAFSSNPVAVAIPAFDRPISAAPRSHELSQLAKDRQLSRVEVLSTQNLLGGVRWNESGEMVVSDDGQPQTSYIRDQSHWPMLDQFPQLKSLSMQPPNSLGSEGWRRIGNLSQLEELTLANIGSSHPKAQKTATADLEAALARLPKLRQLDLRNAGGSLDCGTRG